MPHLFGDFFSDYPKGFCLFLLIGSDKIVLFGPHIDYTFVTPLLYDHSQSLILELRRLLKNQIVFNIENTNNKKEFHVFFAERVGHTQNFAEETALYFCQFLNQYVFQMNEHNKCAKSVYLKNIVYNGYSSGLGVDKKKDFAHIIYGHQNEIEIAPRHKITLEVPEMKEFSCPVPKVFPDVHEPEVQRIYIRQHLSGVWVVGMFLSMIATFIPLMYYAAKD